MIALTPRVQVGLGLLAATVAWCFLARVGPESGLYPPCLAQAWTGLHCPGCGSGRALHALAHGDIPAAFGYNALATSFVAVMLPWSAWQAWGGLKHNRFTRLNRPSMTGWIIVGLITAFTLARNLPWSPFSWLAPSG